MATKRVFSRTRGIHSPFWPNERTGKTPETGLFDHAPRTDQSRGRDRQRVGRWRSKRDSRSSDQWSRGADGGSLSLRRHSNLMTILIRNGRIIDPANERDEVGDLFIVDGRLAKQTEDRNQTPPTEEIDAAGLIVSPGLIDIYVHFREPGFGWKETIESGARAAAAGGSSNNDCVLYTLTV